MDGSKGDALFNVEYDLPPGTIQSADGMMEVKFAAAQGSRTARVFDLRLIK